MKNKTCSQTPVVFSQPAIDQLFTWYPNSNGNLDAEEILDTLSGYYGSRGVGNTYPDVPAGTPAAEILEKIEGIINTKPKFSPVLSPKTLTAAKLKKAYKLELDLVIKWEDADGNKITGTLREVRQEDDGDGHYTILVNKKGGIDTVPMSLITHFKIPGGNKWVEFK
jgi:hypothetical protein